MQAQDGSTTDTANTDSDSTLGTYALRDVISDIPLSTDDDEQAYITCVDAWNGNLYIGTSAGEVLHYVAIPPDPSDALGQSSYIFATKLEPPYTTKQTGRDAGVKEILLLPNTGKACILCNGTLTFYTLPELSPAYGENIKQVGCTWIGGLDLDETESETDSPVIVICLRQRLRLIKLGREARKINRDIELGGVGAIQRRGNLACVADGTAYSLLDVANHRKNELFPISSLTTTVEEERPLPPLPPNANRAQSRSFSTSSPSRQPRGHDRNISLGGEPRDSSRLQPDSGSPWPSRTSSRPAGSSAEPSSREESPTKSDVASPRASTEASRPQDTQQRSLPPNIATPTSTEFLLTTGTQMDEPGIGMFVNLEGDPSRGPLDFSSYPESLVLDGSGQDEVLSSSSGADSEGYVLAVVQRKVDSGVQKAIEVQRWDVDPGEQHRLKEWLTLESSANSEGSGVRYGLKNATSSTELSVPEISSSLRLRRLQLSAETNQADTQREAEEDSFATRFAQMQARILFHSNDKVYWVVRNPLINQLDRRLAAAVQVSTDGTLSIEVGAVQHVMNDLRGQEPRDELEFFTLTYIRQKASVLLLGNLLVQTANGFIAYESGKRLAEEALIAGELDPRIVLSLIPPLQQEIDEGKNGIWISSGLRDTIDMLRSSIKPEMIAQDPTGAYGDNLLAILKRLLVNWRKKKGFGSVADEAQVFRTVDAALLYILLTLDRNSPRGPAPTGSIRAELNEVVDGGVACFDRAVELFEQFNRLYMLSRLYQWRKMSPEVLATWRRILEGETDTGGELIDGEQDLRRYLAKIRDQNLVQEYGVWLANRNPKLGVQVFADDSSRVKFEPTEAVAILKQNAPGAVKDYLEHLVFGNNHIQYVNDLIAFYLDTVLYALESSPTAKKSLLDSYTTYRALRPPKPTYRDFITDNSTSHEEWQRSRLRLLQLIGGSHGAASSYDVPSLRARLAPYSDELVPEMIILNGREGQHEQALHLLTHGLGDYDTAIRYCLLGGESIFHPTSSTLPKAPLPSKEDQSYLFSFLLREFFLLPDLSERLERTAEILERFGGWFDVQDVLEMIPEEWSVEIVGAFLMQALRRLVAERRETGVVRALAGGQNLRWSADLVEKVGAVKGVVVKAEEEEEGVDG